MSQVFDIILFVTGAIVTLLTCFAPYNFQLYNDSPIMESILNENSSPTKRLLNTEFKQNYYEKLISYYDYNNYQNKSSLLVLLFKFMK